MARKVPNVDARKSRHNLNRSVTVLTLWVSRSARMEVTSEAHERVQIPASETRGNQPYGICSVEGIPEWWNGPHDDSLVWWSLISTWMKLILTVSKSYLLVKKTLCKEGSKWYIFEKVLKASWRHCRFAV